MNVPKKSHFWIIILIFLLLINKLKLEGMLVEIASIGGKDNVADGNLLVISGIKH